jgi:hypothetical protein
MPPHMSGQQNGSSITPSGRPVALQRCNVSCGSVPSHSVTRADPIAHRAHEVGELERLHQVELTIGF